MNVAGGILAPAAMRAVRVAISRAGKVIRTKIAGAARPVQTALEPVLVRVSSPRQPIHPIAFLRQQRTRSIHSSSAARQFSPARAARPGPDRTKFLSTKIGRAFSQFTGRAPFASTLRPNLTGGALPRSAGGYGLGSGRIGGARYFSHGPACQAQVIQNVSQAVRAFWISGQKAQFDGLNARGEARFRAVSAFQDETMRKLAACSFRNVPGSNLDFRLNPTVTALGPLAAAFPFPSSDAAFAAEAAIAASPSINTEGFLDVLSGDFARALKDLMATLSDLQKLATLGDLPVQLEKGGHILRVRFPGVDADTVESLCADLGLTRGLVTEDADFDKETGVPVALKFPFASTVLDSHDAVANQYAPTRRQAKRIRSSKRNVARHVESPAYLTSIDESLHSLDSYIIDPYDEALLDSDIDEEITEMFAADGGYSEIIERNPWLASSGSSSAPSAGNGYESMSPPVVASSGRQEDYEGLEGVYRFLEECDRAQGRF